MSPHKIIPTLCIVLALTTVAAAAPVLERQSASQILAATGVKGGLIVHVGCGDGRLTAALRANNSYVVHGLDSNPRNIAAARKHIKTLGQYGSVSVEQWSGDRLPYIDNSVNLIVSEDLGGVSNAEVMRVLAPKGLAYVKKDGRWIKTVKPRPKEIDEWTHYLHDPSNNAVAHDSIIEPPSRYQWLAGPRYARQHDHMSSVSAVVSTNGRLFYIFDEAPPPEKALLDLAYLTPGADNYNFLAELRLQSLEQLDIDTILELADKSKSAKLRRTAKHIAKLAQQESAEEL